MLLKYNTFDLLLSSQEEERADDLFEAADRNLGGHVPSGQVSRRLQARGDRRHHQATGTESSGGN